MLLGNSHKGYAPMSRNDDARRNEPPVNLKRAAPPSGDEWRLLIRWMLSIIHPHLSSLAQIELGDYDPKKHFGGAFGPLKDEEIPELAGDASLMTTRGLWFSTFAIGVPGEGYRKITVNSHHAEYRDHKDFIWGLSRNGRWVLCVNDHLHERDYEGLGRSPVVKITRVTVSAVTVEQLVAECPRITLSSVFSVVNNAVNEWCAECQKRADAAQEVVDTLDTVVADLNEIYRAQKRAELEDFSI